MSSSNGLVGWFFKIFSLALLLFAVHFRCALAEIPVWRHALASSALAGTLLDTIDGRHRFFFF